MEKYNTVPEKGYVIRCVDQINGRVLYRGSRQKYAYKKDALMPNDTYTFSGAKRALANLQRMYPEACFYSIERLSCYYFNLGDSRKISEPNQKIYSIISHSMTRLDELWDGNDFHREDKMRINEIRKGLREIKTILMDQEKAEE